MSDTTHMKKIQNRLLRPLICLCISAWMPGYAAAQPDQPVSSARVSVLLGKARTALQENRLTVPSGDNAVGYAQQVLDLAPGHPEAQRILRTVVARYETLGNASLDRAEIVWKTEIEKAQTYQQRGSQVAREFRLADNSLAKIETRIANTRQLRVNAPADPVAESIARTEVVEIVERYLGLSEEASSQGALAEAESHLSVSRDLMTRYDLSEAERHRLMRRLTHTERQLAARKAADAGHSAASLQALETSLDIESEKSVFIPPSF